MAQAVFGIADTLARAEAIVSALREAGFPSASISVLFPDRTATHGFRHEGHTKAPEGAATGLGTGAVLGGALGWLSGIGAIAIPGLGPFIAAGPILALLSGATAGAAVGGISGALLGFALPEFEAKLYEGHLERGNHLISIHTESVVQQAEARDILTRHGATDVSQREEASV